MEHTGFAFLMLFLGLALGGALGWYMTWLYTKAERARLEATCDAEADKVKWIEGWIENSRLALGQTFRSLAVKALKENALDFSGRVNQNLNSHAQRMDGLKNHLEKGVSQSLESHRTHIGDLKTALEKSISQLDAQVRGLEQKREGAYHALKQQVSQLDKAHSELMQTTRQLLSALKSGPIRGRWGEIQLRKIVELAGLSEHVSFAEQVTGDAGGRPDSVVYLPNEGRIPIDSKFPLQAFLEGIETNDENYRRKKFEEHVKVMREKIKELSSKNYWREFDPSPELTIMFIPIESCLMVAYERDPEIIDFALTHKVILASPVTLLGFMKSIAYGWQQFTISKNAREILAQGKELHRRVETWMAYYRKTGKMIVSLSDAYNESVASLQSRVLPACRKFEELTAITDSIKDVEHLSIGVRLPTETHQDPSSDGQVNTDRL